MVNSNKYGTVYPKKQVVLVGSHVEIICYSVTKVTWFNEKGKRLKGTSGSKSIFRISPVDPSDSGVYECKGMNRFRKEFRAYSNVYVAGMLRFILFNYFCIV